MLLEKTGIQIELKDPADIAHLKKLGYTEVKAAPKADKPKASKPNKKDGEA